jgi:hypothetical protein
MESTPDPDRDVRPDAPGAPTPGPDQTGGDVRRPEPAAPPREPDRTGGNPTEWPDERPRDLIGDRITYRARELGPYRRRDAGLYESGLTERYPGLRGSGTRDPRIRSTGPGPGAGTEQDPDRASMLSARIAIVATIVVGQLWALTVMLDAWHEGHDGQTWLLLAFEALSFIVALVVWRAGTTDR